MTQKTFNFPLGGGLDLKTPPASIKPGRVLSSLNYEPDDEAGYKRVLGYERFNGLPSPSEASYWFIYYDQGTGTEPVAGNIVTGLTSTDTAEVMFVITNSGAWGVDAAGWLVVVNATGLFADNETLQVSAATIAVADGALLTGGVAAEEKPAATDALNETYLRAAREVRRADIAAVPGEGPVQGVWLYNGVTYAIRNAVGSATAVMHASSASGFTVVSLGDYIDFSTGAVTSFVIGETITAAPSGATGVVVSVGITSGSFSGGDAAGRIYIKSISGTFTAADTLSAPSTATADCDSAQTAVTLPPGGKYEFYNYNFGGSIGTYSMWGVNGVGRGFSFDGTDFSFIHITGLTDSTDKPQHVAAHKKHLFFSIGSSVQHSSTGLPYEWNAITGAAELATGDIVTGMQDQPGGTLAIFNRNRTYVLYGNDINDWDLTDYNLEKGAIEWSIQDVGSSIYFDDRGVSMLRHSDKFGDFTLNTISELVDPLIQAKKRLLVDSVRIRSKDQYRVFFSDGTGLILRVDTNPQHRSGQRYEFMPIAYTAQVTSICSEEDTAGYERTFFGSDDGFVYEAEKGESFDGGVIKFFMRLAFAHCQSPRQKKRFHKATFQVDAPDQTAISFSPEFSYGAQPGTVSLPVADFSTGGGEWDGEAFWGEFIWDGQLIGEAEAYIEGQGINISLAILGETNYERAHTWESCTYNYSTRGLRR
ncbi:MAG: hypothetical protein OEN02_03175 [Gammaproteobacteria bacterium]|nr:hypothetical protein [Gammaproteobacteria bacterium]MDH3467813.1 hypothetical protein [Gammaproteobacteria bacterium]